MALAARRLRRRDLRRPVGGPCRSGRRAVRGVSTPVDSPRARRHRGRGRRLAERCASRPPRPCCISPPSSRSASRSASPSTYYRTNVIGTLTVLGAMIEAGVKRFVFSSTAATFGEPLRTPIDDTHPQQPINAYGETKLAIERALPHLSRAPRAAVDRAAVLQRGRRRSVRPHRGRPRPGRSPDSAGARGRARAERRLTLFGEDYPTPDGTCIRDFVHVTDLADAHVAALQALEASGPSTAYNLGHRARHVGPGVARQRRAGDRPRRAASRPGRGGPAIRRGSWPRASGSAANWAGRRSSATSTTS